MIEVIGGGLAGSEAAWQIAQAGYDVALYEMRPEQMSPVHRTDGFAEIVCSNSLHSQSMTTAAGILKHEMSILGSLLIPVAQECSVPAGSALAVDREKFSARITGHLENHPRIHIVRRERKDFSSDTLTIVATGPLSSEGMTGYIQSFLGCDNLFFYDAIAPVVAADSIDYEKAFFGSRYDKGDDDYLNLPLEEDEYYRFVEVLTSAEQVQLHGFEKKHFFEGCLPVEEIASRGPKTLAFGPLRPVGFRNSHGKRPYAVVQLRRENEQGTAFNIVGFQTNLTYGEQKRVFRMLPGLEHAEFLKLGQMHRNTYINAPETLFPTMQSRKNPDVFFAGQLTGVEGYCESAASGLLAGINTVRKTRGQELCCPPPETVMGALFRKITSPPVGKRFQPENSNFGILNGTMFRKSERKQKLAERACEYIEQFQKTL